MHAKTVLLALLLPLGLIGSAGHAAEPFQRWAIVASPEVQSSGVADLLTLKLSEDGVELVERDQLAAATRELELSQLQQPAAAGERLKLGKILEADALVLLSSVEQNKQRFVRLVISETRYGSRLTLEHFAFSREKADVLAVECAATVLRVRQRFQGGVERIIAVSPFLSKNLTRDFDHLPFGFSALLGQTLGRLPGVAVLEIEEVRAISKELLLAEFFEDHVRTLIRRMRCPFRDYTGHILFSNCFPPFRPPSTTGLHGLHVILHPFA